jgi:hypothetical protein
MTQIPGYPDYSTHSDWGSPEATSTKTSGYAVASLVAGVVGLVTCCTFVPSILGIVFGGIALPLTHPGEAKGRGMAIAGIVLGIIGVIAGIVVLIIGIQIPEAIPISGSEVSASDRADLESMGVLEAGEEIELFYAGGLTLKESGALVTDRRLVLYHGESDIEACPLQDVRAVEFTPGSGWLEEGQFLVECEDEEMLLFSVAAQQDGDKRFHRILTRQASKARQAAGKPAVASEFSDASEDWEQDISSQ